MSNDGIIALMLDGWEDLSTWGWDSGIGSLYAQLTRNGRSDANGPEIWLTPPRIPETRSPAQLALYITRATGAALPEVYAAMNDALPDGHPFRLPAPEDRRPVKPIEYGRQSRITSVDHVAESDWHRQLREFLTGTIECTGVLGLSTGNSAPGVPAVLLLMIENEAEDPYLKQAFDLVDRHGGLSAAEQMTAATSWTLIDDGQNTCIVKLKIEFHRPWTARVDIGVPAIQHADRWPAIVGGGIVAIASRTRFRVVSPNADFAAALNACLLVQVPASPVLQTLLDRRGWAGRHND